MEGTDTGSNLAHGTIVQNSPELRRLSIGESIDLPNETQNTRKRYYEMAKVAGIHVSGGTIDDNTVRVTRVV